MSALDTAYSRLSRAGEHLAELKAVAAEVCNAQAEATVIKMQPAGAIVPGQVAEIFSVDNTGHKPVPPRCAILAGDFANSIRSSLNYLVHRLAVLDTPGVTSKRNQFPIELTPEAFKGNTSGPRGFLNGLSASHTAVIESLQPYNGCEWTEALSKISNQDKHIDLVVVQHDQLLSITAETKPATSTTPAAVHMNVSIQPALRISLADGMPLIETLELVESQVTKLLDALNPEFE